MIGPVNAIGLRLTIGAGGGVVEAQSPATP